MNIKKSISLITIFVFSFIFCIAFSMNQARAQVRGDYLTCIDGECETENDNESATLSTAQSTAMPIRAADWFQRDTATSGWGATVTQFSYGPDLGFGETAQGYEYTDPLTGASVSYKVTGIGMGTIPLPMYGGMNSTFGTASYGPYAYGNQPVTQSTPGYDTQTSQAGSAFGQGYQYSMSQPNVTSMVGMSLLQNPFTMGAGLSLAAMSGAFSGYGYSGAGALSSPSYLGGGYGYPSYAGYGGYAPSASYGYPSYAGYSGYGASAAYGYPSGGYSGYNTGYSTPYSYGGYAPSYGGYYTGSGTYPRYY